MHLHAEEEFSHNIDYIELLAPFHAAYIGIYVFIRRRSAAIAKKTLHYISSMRMEQSTAASENTSDLSEALAALAHCAQEQLKLRADLHHQLDAAREILATHNTQQGEILRHAADEMNTQYCTILGYANYLDERVRVRGISEEFRHDFDDVCESGFNLKLIAGALDMLQSQQPVSFQVVCLPNMMQRTLLALSHSLDRRAMKLTTAEVDLAVTASTDPIIIAHVLWMMLLGTIRYAEDESTLSMRCRTDTEQQKAIMSITVSALAPGAMTHEERYTHLQRQDSHESPHMFAQTIRDHANIQLAQLLLQKLDAQIEILPLSNFSCEICLKLPLGR